MRKYATAKKVNREIQQSGDHLISVQHLKREQNASEFLPNNKWGWWSKVLFTY